MIVAMQLLVFGVGMLPLEQTPPLVSLVLMSTCGISVQKQLLPL